MCVAAPASWRAGHIALRVHDPVVAPGRREQLVEKNLVEGGKIVVCSDAMGPHLRDGHLTAAATTWARIYRA